MDGERRDAAAALGAQAAVISYAGQRLFDAATAPTGVLAQAHIPYFYRLAWALLHGLLVGLGVWRVLGRAEGPAAARFAGRALPVVVGIGLLTMALVP